MSEQNTQTPTEPNTAIGAPPATNRPGGNGHAGRGPGFKPKAPRKPQPPADPDAIVENPRAEAEAFTQAKKAGKKEYKFTLVNGKAIKAELVTLGRYTYTVDWKDENQHTIRLLLQKHAVLYVTLGELPSAPTGPAK